MGFLEGQRFLGISTASTELTRSFSGRLDGYPFAEQI